MSPNTLSCSLSLMVTRGSCAGMKGFKPTRKQLPGLPRHPGPSQPPQTPPDLHSGGGFLGASPKKGLCEDRPFTCQGTFQRLEHEHQETLSLFEL